MKRFINYLLVAGACVGAFYLIGLICPRSQASKAKAKIEIHPQDVQKLVNEFESWPSWHPTFVDVEERAPKDDHPVWKVTDRKLGTFDLEVKTKRDAAGWVGSWTADGQNFTLRFDFKGFGPDGSLVVVNLQQNVSDPWKRARRLFLGNPLPLDEMLTGLGRKLGVEAALIE